MMSSYFSQPPSSSSPKSSLSQYNLNASTSCNLSRQFHQYVQQVLFQSTATTTVQTSSTTNLQNHKTSLVSPFPLLKSSKQKSKKSIRLPEILKSMESSSTSDVSEKKKEPESTSNNHASIKEEDMLYRAAIDVLSSRKKYQQQFVCQWKQCRVSFSTKTGLATHVSSHLQDIDEKEGNMQCFWENCQETFEDKSGLIHHMGKPDHLGQKPFFSKNEVEQQSKKRKRYACSICGKSFTDSSNRKKHEKTHDKNRVRYHCDFKGCSRSYSTKTDLRIHQKIHSGILPHQCSHPDCHKAFVRLSELYAHERTHDKILPHYCSQCGKRFREKSRLEKHECFPLQEESR